MENYKKKLESSLKFDIVYCCILFVLTIAHIVFTPNVIDNSLIIGFFAGSLGAAIGSMNKTRKLLKNDDLLKNAFIMSSDERVKTIEQAVGNTTLKIILVILSLALIISAFLNEIVCLTLLFSLVFIVIVMSITRVYYNKKI